MIPEIAFAAPTGCVPGGILRSKLRGAGNESAVLDDEWRAQAKRGIGLIERSTRSNNGLFCVIRDQIACGFAGIHAESRDTPGMIVIEGQVYALLVGVEKVSAPAPGSLLAQRLGSI